MQIPASKATDEPFREASQAIACRVYHDREALQAASCAEWAAFAQKHALGSLRSHPLWLSVFTQGLQHVPYAIAAVENGRLVGLLPLCFIRSLLFGRFLVSLPYVNSGGVLADRPEVANGLIDRAVALADDLNVRYLELRHEMPIDHPALTHTLTTKVHMRLTLPQNSDRLWADFDPKVRNQIRKAEKLGLTVHWGSEELLLEFYEIFSHNMRDLGTPVFGRALFRSILRQFADRAELCVVRYEGCAVAAGLLLHADGMTEVPSASSLRRQNATNANMLMYWHLLQHAVARGQKKFDFGRSSVESNTYRFKAQWGALPEPAAWQYYVRQGSVGDMRLESGKYDGMVRMWRRLPVALTRWIGPAIVRGIP